MSTSGSHPAVEDKSLEAHAQALPARIFKPGALTVLVALGVGGVLTLGTLAIAQSKVSSAVDAGIAPVAAELAQHKLTTAKAIDQVKEDVAAVKRQLEASEERSARRFEVLYNTILERRPQPGADELTKPQTDGGR